MRWPGVDSSETGAVLNRLVWCNQDHGAVLLRKTRYQTLGLYGSDLLRREIDNGHHLPAHQRIWLIEMGDLRTRFQRADLFAKINVQDIGGFARLGESLCRYDRAHAQLHPHEITPVDGLQNTFLNDGGQRLVNHRARFAWLQEDDPHWANMRYLFRKVSPRIKSLRVATCATGPMGSRNPSDFSDLPLLC